MNMVAAQEIKRRGIGAVDEAVRQGPVCIVKNNRPRYVVLSGSDYEQMAKDLAEARLTASEEDVKAGRIRRGSAVDLIREINRND